MAPALRMTRSIKEKLPFFCCCAGLPSSHVVHVVEVAGSTRGVGYFFFRQLLLACMPAAHVSSRNAALGLGQHNSKKKW
jgi:hypothetical protein